ncbi:MAG: DUF1552 domain-containing protein [Verrucomicrobiota bacterium]|jgi:hypothetical protein|nr:DUF1552 domain-containing protein [Verrucomicrobiota bacterium]
MHITGTFQTISRRAVLKGVGAALALPWLEAMMSSKAKAAQKASPRRLGVLFMPNGVRQDQWTPEGEGRDFKLSKTLAPLEHLRDRLVIPTNLWNQASDVGDGHYVKTSGFLTCQTISKSLGFDLNSNGISMDQLVARGIGGQTPLASLELAINPVSIGVDTNVGYTRVYGSHIAWSRPTRPLAREINPRLVFERLFRVTHPRKGDGPQERLLLDRVLGDARQLRGKVGYHDRMRIDDYLESVRILERRIEQASKPAGKSWQPAVDMDPAHKPAGIPGEHMEHVRLMLDMIALAFQTDSTRVCTFMFGNAVGNTNFSFLEGVNGGHHSLSHHENKEENLVQYQRIAQWHVAQYAYLLDKLKAMPEGESNVLDNSMILFGSGLRDGNRHSPRNLPLVIAGSGGGRIQTGQHLVHAPNTPLANLYCSMLQAMDTPVASFADSTGKLPGVLI